ncbi:microsomal signal peptidase subunit [Lentinus tigrinus ALCF2SS1-7]|uniref:Signal peptidase complex subunit 1 n=1 Tax=Lentinus tigrinus ALCF2SS1-6 TaxID=1328759 RepID=A0A5C2RSK9_9APHY|nr:microsomal signal peptidase subunit [Lentinus tigrinus ALCF2SS1-6]RPD70007.1 microsomal signal peptidase subunit [Lentinus tigrinus ALCF2SS1-7]
MGDILQKYLEGKIDFEGQKLVEQISRNALIAATVVSFVAGFASQSLRVLFGVFALFVIVLCAAVIPPWPAYRRHPVKWLPAKNPKDQ